MTNQQILEGDWNVIKGKLLKKWGQLTDGDLPQFSGDVDQLIGVLQIKTGEGRAAIETYLQEMSANAAAAIGAATETARDYAQHAAHRVRAGYDEAECFVRDRPVKSLLVCFGVGLIAGVAIALSLRSR
jgi:uncharacterized protein YjbJ (UPF0337 family)